MNRSLRGWRPVLDGVAHRLIDREGKGEPLDPRATRRTPRQRQPDVAFPLVRSARRRATRRAPSCAVTRSHAAMSDARGPLSRSVLQDIPVRADQAQPAPRLAYLPEAPAALRSPSSPRRLRPSGRRSRAPRCRRRARARRGAPAQRTGPAHPQRRSCLIAAGASDLCQVVAPMFPLPELSPRAAAPLHQRVPIGDERQARNGHMLSRSLGSRRPLIPTSVQIQLPQASCVPSRSPTSNRSASISWFRGTISRACARRDLRRDRSSCARGVVHRDLRAGHWLVLSTVLLAMLLSVAIGDRGLRDSGRGGRTRATSSSVT